MASTFGTLEIAKTGMMTYNTALQTTAHNIANIETKGYSRQTTNITALTSTSSAFVVQGNGVDVTSITRDRDEYYDVKYQKTQSKHDYYETEAHYLRDLQDQLAGDVTSQDKILITDAFDEFYAALSSLKDAPGDDTIRTKTVTVAQTFAETITNSATGLQRLQDEVNQQIKTVVEQINSIADKIVSLNEQINLIEAYGTTANDLRDQRAVLVDELACYVNVEYSEMVPASGIGGNQFAVYVNGAPLVDHYNTNKLVVTQKDTFANICDMSGMYMIEWEDGTDFNEYSSKLGGELQALFEFRDGNNGTIFEGKIDKESGLSNDENGNLVLTLTGTNCNDITELNIPSYDGELVIRNITYPYDSFEVKVDDAGNYSYIFTMKSSMNADEAVALKNAMDRGYTVSAGHKVESRGVPYYMAQINEFVRTFSQEFNRIQNEGYDIYDNRGIDFFNAKVPATGDNYNMQESENGLDKSFTSIPEKNADGTYTGSYYYMTALNFGVTEAVREDGRLMACKTKDDPAFNVGNDNGDNLQKMIDLKGDSGMFLHGNPDSFLQSVTATLGVDAKKAETLEKSQQNLLYAIDSSRKSVSGVDEDEEGANLVLFQNMLSYQYKVISVLNEVIDKLINDTV